MKGQVEKQMMDARIRRFILAVMRNVYLKPEARRRIAEDLRATMLAASEDRPVEDVIRDMGSPVLMANELMSVHATSTEDMGILNAMMYAARRPSFEIKSKARIGDKPLVHVAMGYDEATGGVKVADGIIAIGTIAKGWIAAGGVAIGGLAFGGVALGGIALGGVAVGLVGLGGLALALLLALGGLALAGGVSVGGLAVAVWTAIGGLGRAMHYYVGSGQSAVLPEWATWIATHVDQLSWVITALIGVPLLYLSGHALSKALGLDIRDILE